VAGSNASAVPQCRQRVLSNVTRRRQVGQAKARIASCSQAGLHPGSRHDRRSLYPGGMAATPTPEGTPQRLAAIRAQMSLLADYL
jgi:hypothetical protein